jgi:hypothetical protein
MVFYWILGDYEKKGEFLKSLGKFIAFALDDPLHFTTFTGLLLYGIGKYREKTTNYGIIMFKRDFREISDEVKRIRNDILSISL